MSNGIDDWLQYNVIRVIVLFVSPVVVAWHYGGGELFR